MTLNYPQRARRNVDNAKSEHIKQNRIVQIDSLMSHPRNYRIHPKHQIDKLVLSLQRFGQGRSIVVQDSPEHPVIVAGHGIVEAAQALQWQELRADILPADWTDTQIEGYLIADNLHSEEASDNEELLAMLLQEQQDAGFDLASLGTDDETLRQMIEAMGDGYLNGAPDVQFKEYDETVADDLDTELCEQCGKLCMKSKEKASA
jgi:ParB-like chromosome segregation protein Spo0J